MQGRVLSSGMGDSQETDNYEERLREVFSSFDASGTGSLSPEELADLCQSLHLDDAVPALLHALVQNEDRITGRVEFDQFKNALILVLSSSIEAPHTEQETSPQPESAEIQPKFVKGSKRYGRHSTPEYIETVTDFSEVINTNPADGLDPEEENEDAAVPRKRERWNAHEAGTEEYEAEGQLHLWNPDEPSTPRGSVVLPSVCSEERLREACRDLGLPWDGCAERRQLVALCDQLGLELRGDLLQSASGGGVVNIQEFVSMLASQTKPPTPSASTPYRQLKRHHSTQPFDEAGRRIATPSVMTSTIGMRLFSALDDGTGCTPVEYILDAWMEEGIENSTEILQALDFSLNGKLNLSELTMALENELLVTKNGIHQAALASFKAEIRHLLERVEQELGEKERIRCDLEKAEKLKSQLATEVDEHHSAIEHMNNLNLRKLEQEHKEKLAAVRSELIQEVEQIQQQAGLHREELEAEIKKIRDDESFLRDHLSISVKENRRLELELFDSTEKLVEAQSQVAELQTSLDNILREKFGDLDPGSADFFNQEERIKQLHSSYEAQCRELQDRVDELQSELQEFHSLGRVPQHVGKPLSEELESKSPGMESDPGLGSEEGQPFNMSLEAEMMLEHLKEQHLQQIEILRTQLENKITEFDQMTEQQRVSHEEQKAAISLQYQEEIQGLTETMTSIQNHAQELQHQLEEVELEQANLELRQAGEREELKCQQEKEVETIRQQLLETHTHATDLEEQLKTLKAQHAEAELCLYTETEELKKHHALELKTLEQRHKDLLEEERIRMQEERAESEQRLLEKSETEKEQLKQDFEDDLRARLEEANRRFEEECEELTRKLAEEWQKEKAQLDEQSNDSLQAMLEEEMLRLVREQEERESKLREEWEIERAQLQGCQEEAVLTRLVEERLKLQEEQEQRESRLKEEWERDKLQLEEDYEGMLQDRLNEERDKLDAEKEDVERRFKQLMEEEKTHLEESHREAMQELTVKHSEERERLGSVLDKLRDDIAEERRELQITFTQRIKEVEARFSGDQESVAERFHTDISNLERRYQSELEALSESHDKQKHQWQAEMEKALEEAEEQKRMMQEAMKQERESINQEWAREQAELESSHKEEHEALGAKNHELQKELDDFVSSAQTREIELSRQLNDLHNRLRESLENKDELLVQSERRVHEIELLLNKTVEDFKQERSELQDNLSELEAKYKQALSITEKQICERIELLTEHDDLKVRIEELEMILKQATMDFRLERQELQENISILEEKLKDNICCCGSKKNEKVEIIAERDILNIRIKEIENELNQFLASVELTEKKSQEISTELSTPVEETAKIGECMHLSDKEKEMCAKDIKTSETCNSNFQGTPDGYDIRNVESVAPVEQLQKNEMEMIPEHSSEVETCPDCDISNSSNKEAVGSLSDLSIPVQVSAFLAEESKDSETEMRAETPDALGECPENAEQVAKCENELPAISDDDMSTMETTAVEDQEQDCDATKEERVTEGEELHCEIINIFCEEVAEVGDITEDGRVGSSPGHDDQKKIEEFSSRSETNSLNGKDYCALEMTLPDDFVSESPVSNENVDAKEDVFKNRTEFSQVKQSEGIEADPSPEALDHEDAGGDVVDSENNVAVESCEDNKPQYCLVKKDQTLNLEEAQCLRIVVDPSALGEEGDLVEQILWDTEIDCLRNESHGHGKNKITTAPEIDQATTTEIGDEEADCAYGFFEAEDQNGHCEDKDCSLFKLMALYSNATEENILLQQNIALLQQKADTLENLLVQNSEKMEIGHQALEENYKLKVKMVFLMKHAKELEVKTLEMTHLQIKYENCTSENAKLKEINNEFEKRVMGLESRMDIANDFQDQQIVLVDEIAKMRDENDKLCELVNELERQDGILLALHQDAGFPEMPTEGHFQDLNSQMEAKIQAVTDLEDCCMEFEEQNAKLRRAITELQDKSLMLSESMQAHRSEASRLSEENLILRHKIATLKEEDLKEAQEELLLKLGHYRKEKIAAQKMAENFKKQISELRHRSQQLEEENVLLTEKNAQNAAEVEELSQQVVELIKENERRKAVPDEDETQMAACVSALEAELTRALEGNIHLEGRNAQLTHQLSGLRDKVAKVDSMESQFSHLLQERKTVDKVMQSLGNQLAKAQEKIQALDDCLKAVNLQSTRLKSDLHVSLDEGDALKHEVMSLHKKLQNANDKNHVLEVALHSSGLQSQHKKLCRDEVSRVLEQEQQLLRQENERLQVEVHNTKGDLVHSREKVRQLESTILSLKQQKQQSQSYLVKALEQENASLKQELKDKNKLTKGCEAGERHAELESLQQENEALKAQMARLSTQLLEAFQAQLVGLLPPSPHRIPRGQRGDDPDNMQDERERKMKNMEGRMREIEQSLHNVKMLLKEKVAQLKDQLHKNGKADVLIKDLYVENAQLLKALEVTEHRQKNAEKKNYLLEEKISSLNKIVRDLNPLPLPPVPHHFQSS